MKVSKYFLEDIIIYFLILYTTLYKIMPFSKISILDEALLFALLIIVCIDNRIFHFNMPTKIMLAFLMYSLVITLFNFASVFGFFSELLYLIKTPLIFITLTQVNMNEKRRNRFYVFF